MKFPFRDNRGSALVELALTCPLFFALIMGSAELGRVAYYAIEVENAARAGASFGSANIADANQTATVQQAALNDAPDVSNLIVVTQGSSCVCETIDPSTGSPSFSGTMSCTASTITSCTADSSSSIQSVVEYVTVSTSATIDPMVHVPGLPTTYNLSGYSALRILSN